MTFIYVIAVVMMVAGAGFMVLIARQNKRIWPRDAIEGVGMVMSLLLIASSAFLIYLAVGMPEPEPIDTEGYPVVRDSELNVPAPDFTFRLVDDGAERALADYKGSVVLVNFWATWCGPCLREQPSLNELQNRYRDDGFVLLSISDEPREDLLAFRETLPMATTEGYVTNPEQLPTPYSRTIRTRPTSYLIDRDGVVRKYVLGVRELEQWDAMVRQYVNQPLAAR